MINYSRERCRVPAIHLLQSLRSRFGAGGLIFCALGFAASPPARGAETFPTALLPVLTTAAVSMADPCSDSDGDSYPLCDGTCDPGGQACDCNDANASIHPGATEICNGKDDDCNGQTDELVDPDPIDGINNNNNFDSNNNPLIDEGFGFCLYQSDGPVGQCKTAGRQECHWPPGPVLAEPGPFGTLTCVLPPNAAVTLFAQETIANAKCGDARDNDCDGFTDIHDTGCQTAEVCDGLDNDGDGVVDDGFNVGQACSDGVGACLRNGVLVCSADHLTSVCSANPGPKGKEGATFANTCDNTVDDDCDGAADLADTGCANFDKAELCNGVDDNGNLQIDETFVGLGLPCTAGLGACVAEGIVVCKADGSGTECDGTPGTPVAENSAAGDCHDNVDNDCDGAADAADPKCAEAFADLGVTCSLPYRTGRPGRDCNGKNIITFSGGQADEVKADLLALNPDGSLIGMIEDVASGEEAQLASRVNVQIETKRNRYKIHAPVPLLRVTGKKGGVEDVAYCSILPYLEVTKPAGETVSLSESQDLAVGAYLPLVDVDRLGIKLDGIDVLAQLGINPGTAFPTLGTALCATAGSCTVKVPAGCGDGSLVDVEISNLRVEGLDGSMVPDARSGVEAPDQVNTVNFTVKGLPAGGHVFYITGRPLPLPRVLARPCHVDDLADAGRMSAFGINVDSPTDQEVVATAPVTVAGTACSGNQIAGLSVNGRSVDVSVPDHQTCTTGDGLTSADECVVHFSEALPERNLSEAVLGSAENASFKRGSNRVVADALDVLGSRAINADVVFALGPVQLPAGAPIALMGAGDVADAMRRVLPTRTGLDKVVTGVVNAMAAQIDPAFVVGLDEAAAKKFFNEVCLSATAEFEDNARVNLTNTSFGTFSFHPDCSCNLDVPVVLEDLQFIDFPETPDNPTCAIDFTPGQIAVTVHLPDIHIKAGAHDSCDEHGLFGECVWRTIVDATAVAEVRGISASFVITETQIETKTAPDPDSIDFNWAVFDSQDRPAYTTIGTCAENSDHPGKDCLGNQKDSDPPFSKTCGGECVGAVRNKDFNPLTSEGLPAKIECWLADLCLVGEILLVVAAEVFTFGLIDGKDLILDMLGLGFDFNEEFLEALKASKPDPFGLDAMTPDEDKVKQAGFAKFTPGLIDVTIVDGGLTATVPAEFETLSVDPTVPVTPGPSVTQASVPTVAQVTAVGDDVTILVADDVFNQIFASMKEAGKLKAICTTGDMLTVNRLLPTPEEGGCDSLGPDNDVGAGLQGICHAIRGADCLALTSDTDLKTNTKKGACRGFRGDPCSVFLPLHAHASAVALAICAATPHRNIEASDGLFLCARQDMDPEFLISADATADPTVDTDLILDKLSVVFGLDRGNDGYTGDLAALKGCWGEEGDAAADCRFAAACADLDLKTRMGIDSSTCSANQAGFVFSLLQVQPQSLDLGVVCNSGTQLGDRKILGNAIESIVTKAIADNSEKFMPPQCMNNLDLNGVLDFHSDEAKLFGLTTSGASGAGFADYLGITVGLQAPQPQP